jgi:hypothetical protein
MKRERTIRLIFSLLIIIFTSSQKLSAYEIGRVIQIEGEIERSSITTGKRYPVKIGVSVRYGQRIKVGKDSFLEILLSNGTSLFIKENSLVFLFNLRMKKKDPPTKLKLAYGKIRVTPKRLFNDRSLILTTQTAAISIVDAKFSVVASEYETKVLAYNSKVGVANINPAIKKAFVIIKGEEVSIRKNVPPSMPLNVPSGSITFWLENHTVTSDFKYITKTTREEGFIDWLLRKREF